MIPSRRKKVVSLSLFIVGLLCIVCYHLITIGRSESHPAEVGAGPEQIGGQNGTEKLLAKSSPRPFSTVTWADPTGPFESWTTEKFPDIPMGQFVHGNGSWHWHSFLQFVEKTKRFDRTRQYAIKDFAIIGPEWGRLSNGSRVCMATHASLSYLNRLPTLGQYWQEWISVAIFVPDVHFQVALILWERLQKCSPDALNKMALHFVYPVSRLPVLRRLTLWQEQYDCERWDENLQDWIKSLNSSGLLYPQNLMRNVARKNCLTDMVFLTDVDFIPMHSLGPKLNSFLAQVPSCEKCAYIVPAYEILENVTLPQNKTELLKLVKQKFARTYRRKVHKLNQGFTNATRWQSLPEGNSIDIGYPLQCFNFSYEPFYVAYDATPPHDERFIGYGSTRNSQVFEMQLAGFRFFVLNNAFIVHPGMAKHPFSSSKRREKQVLDNLKLMAAMMKELQTKYKTNSLQLPCATNQ